MDELFRTCFAETVGGENFIAYSTVTEEKDIPSHVTSGH